eukprot:snap_masked-scaffold_1-processed-gene-13.33-mRNA-1 protein AED:1.00 eAED:1.00 QI:0/0/0/0/1/1/2/0/59
MSSCVLGGRSEFSLENNKIAIADESKFISVRLNKNVIDPEQNTFLIFYYSFSLGSSFTG